MMTIQATTTNKDQTKRDVDAASKVSVPVATEQSIEMLDDIVEIVDFQDYLDRGLVHEPRPAQPLVQTHVDNHSGNLRRGFFHDHDDATGGRIADIADPDEHINFGASGVGL
eukprot:scaffold403125_cov31-Attheya_sp.AAC.1